MEAENSPFNRIYLYEYSMGIMRRVLPFKSHLPSNFNGIEVLTESTSDPELGQTEVISGLKCWLPHIEGGLGSIILFLALCRCIGMLIHGIENKVNAQCLKKIITIQLEVGDKNY